MFLFVKLCPFSYLSLNKLSAVQLDSNCQLLYNDILSMLSVYRQNPTLTHLLVDFITILECLVMWFREICSYG